MRNKAKNLQEVLEYFMEEFHKNGFIKINLPEIGVLKRDSYTLIPCSGIRTEWDEGIYYNPSTGYFFYGELRTGYGGEITYFKITGPLLDLLPDKLKAYLKEVWDTQSSKIIYFSQNADTHLFT